VFADVIVDEDAAYAVTSASYIMKLPLDLPFVRLWESTQPQPFLFFVDAGDRLLATRGGNDVLSIDKDTGQCSGLQRIVSPAHYQPYGGTQVGCHRGYFYVAVGTLLSQIDPYGESLRWQHRLPSPAAPVPGAPHTGHYGSGRIVTSPRPIVADGNTLFIVRTDMGNASAIEAWQGAAD